MDPRQIPKSRTDPKTVLERVGSSNITANKGCQSTADNVRSEMNILGQANIAFVF